MRMGIPILVSRSGFTAWGVELARQVGLTLVGRAPRQTVHRAVGSGAASFSTRSWTYVEEESGKSQAQGRARDD